MGMIKKSGPLYYFLMICQYAMYTTVYTFMNRIPFVFATSGCPLHFLVVSAFWQTRRAVVCVHCECEIHWRLASPKPSYWKMKFLMDIQLVTVNLPV